MADVVVVVRLLAILLLLLLFLLRVRRGGVRGRGGRCLALSSLDLALTDSPPLGVFQRKERFSTCILVLFFEVAFAFTPASTRCFVTFSQQPWQSKATATPQYPQ